MGARGEAVGLIEQKNLPRYLSVEGDFLDSFLGNQMFITLILFSRAKASAAEPAGV